MEVDISVFQEENSSYITADRVKVDISVLKEADPFYTTASSMPVDISVLHEANLSCIRVEQVKVYIWKILRENSSKQGLMMGKWVLDI
jgi:hypothetical protein